MTQSLPIGRAARAVDAACSARHTMSFDLQSHRTQLVLAALGAVLGLGAAIVLHGLPVIIVGDYGFFAFMAPSLSPYDVDVALSWWPSIAVLPGLGLLVGAAAGALLRRRGWALVRTTDTS